MRTFLCRMTAVAVASLACSGVLAAGEKKLMHCFAYTPIKTASPADWQAFHKATDALPSKVPGISKVWYGKLRSPLSVYGVDADTRKKLSSSEKASGEVTRSVREYGVCMEMADEAALKAYAAHPYHKDWVAAYEKVRVAGTTTFDILGQ